MFDEDEGASFLEIVLGGVVIYFIFKMLCEILKFIAVVIIWFFSSWRFELPKNEDGSPVSTWQESLHLLSINWQPLGAILALAIYFSFGSSVELNPVQPVYASVEARSLNVRQAPQVTATVIDGLKRDERVEVINQKNDWTQIKADKRVGWVASRYLLITK
jgi:hypothetical protein